MPVTSASVSLVRPGTDDSQRFALAIAGNSDGVWDWNVVTGEVWFSDRWCAMLGYEPGEIAPHVSAWESLVHPADLPVVMARVADHLEGRSDHYETEHRVRTRDGRWHWILDRGRIVARDSDGRPLRMVGTHTDISRSKGEESSRAVLYELNERLRRVTTPEDACNQAVALIGAYLDVAQVGFGEIDAAQQHVIIHSDWNDGRLASVVGTWRMDDFGPAFIIDMKAGRTVAIPDVARDPRTNSPAVLDAYSGIGTRAILDVPLVRGNQMVAMLFVHHPDERHWTAAEIRTVEQICDRLWFAVEHSRSLAALSESESRFAIAARSVGFAAWDWDVASSRLNVSEGFHVLHDLSPAIVELGSRDASALAELRAQIAALAGDPGRGSFDIVYPATADPGAGKWIRALGAVTRRDAHGGVLQVHGFITDVTQEKALELELSRLREQTLQTNRLSAIGAVAATLTHELNQPLTAITNAIAAAKLHIARAGLDDPLVPLQRAESAAFRISEIIRRTKRYAATGVVIKSRQSLTELAHMARDLCSDPDLTGRRKLSLRFDVEVDAVQVDPVQFCQVLQNLIRNAWEAGQVDEPCVITIASRALDGQTLVTIADNGPGIDPERAALLFEPFASGKDSGTGLGLAISRAIIERHDGEISYQASPHGAAFAIRLPAA